MTITAYRIDENAEEVVARSGARFDGFLCFAVDYDGAEIYKCNHPEGVIAKCVIDISADEIATQDELDSVFCEVYDLASLADDNMFGGGGLPFERAEDYRTRQALIERGYKAVRYEDGVENQITETIMLLVPAATAAVEVEE